MAKTKEKTVDRLFITKEEALELLCDDDGEYVHVFRNPADNMMVGMDMTFFNIKKAIEDAKSVEIGGEACMGMGHGIVIIPKKKTVYQSDVLFAKHNKRRMKTFLAEHGRKSSLKGVTQTK